MKIFPSSSIKKLDAYTIEHEPIASIDLMERAAQALTKAITNRWNPETPVTIFAGPGNNGGDALAIARMMAETFLAVNIPGTFSNTNILGLYLFKNLAYCIYKSFLGSFSIPFGSEALPTNEYAWQGGPPIITSTCVTPFSSMIASIS